MKGKADIEKSEVSLLLDINGEVHLIGINKDKLEAISFLVKQSPELIIPTGKTQKELRLFLNFDN